MITVYYQDSEIVLFNPYTWTGEADGIYLKVSTPYFNGSVIGNDYRLLLKRSDHSLIQADNEFYDAAYQAIEPSLIGDVLILGGGLLSLDPFLVTGTSWKWVERNAFLAALVPANGTMHQGDAEGIVFLQTLGTFDTILIDFPRTWNNDYSSLLNPGGTIIEFKI